MKLYVTTKNSGPTWSGADPEIILYLGNSEEEAIAAVGDFTKYVKEFPSTWSWVPCALPDDMEVNLEHYYMADGWWRTVCSFEIEESDQDEAYSEYVAQKYAGELND